MTQRKNAFFITTVALILVAESFSLWTGVVTSSVSTRIWSSITDVPIVQQIEQEEQHAAAPEIQIPLKTQIAKESEVVTSPSWRKGVVEESQVEELLQWGVRPWLTLSISSLDLRAQVYLPSARFWDTQRWDLLEEQMQLGLLQGATAYPHSVRPGERGTIFISGHSSPPTKEAKKSAYGSLFAQLPSLQPGDAITLSNRNERIQYQVVSRKVVKAQDTEILLQQEDRNLLKLITCYPVGTTKDRLIVTAREV